MNAAAVCIGNNKFIHSPQNNLNGCIQDAHDMSAYLQALDVPTISIRENSPKADTWGLLKDLRDRARVDKLAYAAFAFSSHGTTYPCQDEADGLGEALVCADVQVKDGDWDMATLITDKELHTLLWTFPDTCTLEIWLDTCFSGGMDRLATASRQERFLAAPGKALGPLFPNSRITVGLPPNVVMWCASSEQQTSADAYIKSAYHGAGTYAWLQAARGNPEASRVEILLGERKWLAVNHYEQLPRLKAWNKAAQGRVGQ